MSNNNPEFISELNIEEEEKGNIKVNDKSFQELLKNMNIGLTAYESICAPRKIINESKIEFNKEQINKVIEEVLRCNICYNIFQNPVSIKGCLHKFCKSCISDYYFKIKKECAICRHPIETKRLLKDDNKIKGIIDCFIPDQNKFKEEEDKIISMQVKDCVFKDEQRHKKQIEKIKNEEDKEHIELKSNNESNSLRNNLLNKKTNRDNHNHHNINSNISHEETQNNEIIVRIICDEKDEDLQKYFKYTRMKVEKSNTLEFISRFICYKQNFKYDQIKKINFYTYENNAKKKEWSQNDKISDVVNYDSKIIKNNKLLQEETKESFYSHLYHLNLYFYIN